LIIPQKIFSFYPTIDGRKSAVPIFDSESSLVHLNSRERLLSLIYAKVNGKVVLLEGLKDILLSIFRNIQFNFASLDCCSHNYIVSCYLNINKSFKGVGGQFLCQLPQAVSLP
jgi:hypothetical protein